MVGNIILLAVLFVGQIPDGTVVFIQKEEGVVAKRIAEASQSSLIHAAIIFNENGTPYVYESTVPTVRRLPLRRYDKHVQRGLRKSDKKPMVYWLARPKKDSFTAEEIKAMKEFADSQIGRRYSLQAWFKEEPQKGVHCSEFVTRTLIKSDKIHSANPGLESPGELWYNIRPWYHIPQKRSVMGKKDVIRTHASSQRSLGRRHYR